MNNDTLFLLWILRYSIVSSHIFAVIRDTQNVLYRRSLPYSIDCLSLASHSLIEFLAIVNRDKIYC